MKLNLAKNQDNVSNLKDIIGHKIFGRFNTHQCDNVPSGHSACFFVAISGTMLAVLCRYHTPDILYIMSDSPQYGES